MVFNSTYRSYSLEGPSFHIEYKVNNDTCIIASIRFHPESGYQHQVKEIISRTLPFGQNRV